MQPALPAPGIFFLFVAGQLLATGKTQGEQTCINQWGRTYGSASCDFQKDQCRWRNIESNRIPWIRRSGFFWAENYYNYYMSATMCDARINTTAALASPWLKPTENQQCTLRFRYYFGREANSRFSVVLLNTTGRTELWSTRRSTQEQLRWIQPPITIPPSNCRHRIIFEARKLRRSHCGLFNFDDLDVDVDDIEFHCTNTSPDTSSTTSSDTSSITSSDTSNGTANAFSPQSSTLVSIQHGTPSQGLKSVDTGGKSVGRNIGLIAGIVLAVVVVVVAVLVFMSCQSTNSCGAIRDRKSGGKDSKSRNASLGDVPCQSVSDNRTTTGNTHDNPAFVSNDGVTSVYVIASDPDYLIRVPNKTRGEKEAANRGHQKKGGGAASTEQGEYNTLSMTTLRASVSTVTAPASSARSYDHVQLGHQTSRAGTSDPTRVSRQTEEVYEHTKW